MGLAGFLFVGIAIYLAENYSDTETNIESTALSVDLEKKLSIEELGNIELKQLRELEKLERLSELEDLEKLESLKNLSSILPAEIQTEFEAEINAVIKDLKQEKNHTTISTSTAKSELRGVSGRWTVVSPGVYAFYQEFDASQLKETELELPFGSIEIIGTTESKASFSLQASGQITNKADLQSKINTISSIENGKGFFSVTSTEPPSRDQNIQLQATLSIPKKSILKAQTKAGHITSENVEGTQNYHTLGGHINLNKIQGQIQARTSGGHVTLRESKGNFDLQSLGGHIRVNDIEGRVFMKTSGGNLQASNIKGSVQASTNGGNIELRFVGLEGNTAVQTGAGTISIWVPESANSMFNLSGNTVEISDRLNFQGSKNTGSAKGFIGSKNASVQAKTNYGNIILKAQD
jgi:DUF4097 and DUF4098 domain-containing protein YvlB